MLFTRLIVMEKRKRIVKKLSFEDLALLQMGKDLLEQLWNRFRTDKKVVRLEDWRE